MTSKPINEDQRFASLSSRLIGRISESHAVTLTQEIRKTQAAMSARGSLHSSGHAQIAGRAGAADLETRAKSTWSALVRVHQTIGSPLYADLPSHLKVYFREAMEAHLQAVLPIALRNQSLQSARALTETSIRNAIGRAVRANEVEIDIYVESLRTKAAASQTGAAPMATNYNFYGNVGAVQTGPNAVANIESLSPEGRAQLIGALESLKAAFRAAPETALRHDLAEIVDDTKNAISNEKPNLTKVSAYLFALSEAAQGIASAKPAYDALKAIFATAGVFLP